MSCCCCCQACGGDCFGGCSDTFCFHTGCCCGLTGTCQICREPITGSGINAGALCCLPICPQEEANYSRGNCLESIPSPNCSGNSDACNWLNGPNALCTASTPSPNGSAKGNSPSGSVGGGSGGSVPTGGGSGSAAAPKGQTATCSNAVTQLSKTLQAFGTSLASLLKPSKTCVSTVGSTKSAINAVSSGGMLVVLVVLGGLMLFLAFSGKE